MPARFPELELREEALGVGGGRWHNSLGTGLPEDIVISGVSGRLPESDSVKEFRDNLMNNVDMVTADDRRWPVGAFGLPERSGKLKNLHKFDAQFFGVSPKQADVMCPQVRGLLETTYEAIIDSGFNPVELRGSNTGVYVGISGAETGEYWSATLDRINGYGLTGNEKSMVPNRLSYVFDLRGPSMAIDTACSSSLVALHVACQAIRRGEIEAAFVCGSNLNLKPNVSLQFKALGMLSPHGLCRAFDDEGVGYVRSETIVTIFIQKASAARRIYSTIVNTGSNSDGYKDLGITYPNGQRQREMAERAFKEAGVDPLCVSYVEAHGTGTKAGDPQEVNNIVDLFCKGRNGPLLIGSVKSNMGHAEPASGVASLVKLVVAMEEGVIPANLYYNTPNADIPGLVDGRLQVVTENTPWKGGFMALNSFGFGGVNAHVILRSHNKPKLPPPKDSLPRLVYLSGRTEEAVSHFLDKVESMPRDDEFTGLIEKIHKFNVQGHSYRGYTVLGAKSQIRAVSENLAKKQVWFIYSGMGSQWAGMGRVYMCLAPFANAIHKCHAVLKNEGIDLLDLINNGTDETFEKILNNFIVIACIQVALTDLLTAMGIKPDGIVGHSTGEVACAYGDGAFTAEQTALAAYWRGKSILDTKLEKGAMAAVGLTWEQVKARAPPNVIPACHNAADSVTISGPAEEIESFVAQLQKENVFAKKVQSADIAFHSKYISEAGPKLRSSLEKVVPNPKPRSKRWLSSSIPESGWGSQLAALSSAAYHVNNLLSPVLFHEAVSKVPGDSIVIEIAPHALLQAVLKRSMPKSCVHIGMAKRGVSDEMGYLLQMVGNMYLAGLNPDLSVFHHPISFPVSRGTPMLNSMVEWDHSLDWAVANFSERDDGQIGETVTEVDISTEEWSYVSGHTIDGRCLFPATGYLTLIWKAFAKTYQKAIEDLPIVMENVTIHRATIMPKQGVIKFGVSIFESSGTFELSEGGATVVTGHIRKSDGIDVDGTPGLKSPVPTKIKNKLDLKTKDIYRDLRLRGYDYSGAFKGVVSSDNAGANGKLQWTGNWVSFMDTILQFSLIGLTERILYVPTRLLKVTIDPVAHLKAVQGKSEIDVRFYPYFKLTRTPGIEVKGMKASAMARRLGAQSDPKMETYTFVPYEGLKEMQEEDALTVAIHTVIENVAAKKIKVVEIADGKVSDTILTRHLISIIESEPTMTADILVASADIDTLATVLEPLMVRTSKKRFASEPIESTGSYHFIIGNGLMKTIDYAAPTLLPGGFVITKESKSTKVDVPSKWVYIGKMLVDTGVYYLIRKKEQYVKPIEVKVDRKGFKWLNAVKDAMKDSEKNKTKYLLVNDLDGTNGLIGLFNCLKREPGGDNLRCMFMADGKSPKNIEMEPQLAKDLLMNVYKGGMWGSMRHLKTHLGEEMLKVEHAYAIPLVRGDLSSLRWIEGPNSLYFNRPDLTPNREMCIVYYSPLNFRDIMLASGKLPVDAIPGDPSDCVMGLEFAGRDMKGRRVIGIVESQGFATTVLADPDFLWTIPAQWTMEMASTIPCVYCTSYYGLLTLGKLKKGESVLIHAGAGGVGQSAIRIALNMECEVFTTVGSPEKKKFLLEQFPKLKEENIGNSRNGTFEQLIMERTDGRGVNLVLNSLAGELLQASLRCLAEFGRFIEIGKADMANNTALGMAGFLKSISVHGLLLDALMNPHADKAAKQEVARLLKTGIETGVVQPIPNITFESDQLETAFRYMAAGKHMGKVLIKIKEEEETKIVKNPKPAPKMALPRTYMKPDKIYVIIGGLGGFGLELCQWLLQRKARHVMLTSRSGVTQGYQELCLRRWAEKGFNVYISTCDASTESGALKLIREANQIAPVGGLFNLAAVLRDKIMENQTEEDFIISSKPKVDTTVHLDKLSRVHCPELDYFVCFSSVSCGRGNEGQPNYGWSNSVMERICEARQAEGLPGIAIQWGAIGDVGLVIEELGGTNETVIGGTLPQRIDSCMNTMDVFLQDPYPVVASMVLAESQRGKAKVTTITLMDAIGNILGVKNTAAVGGAVTLAELGMDSIMGTEIKQTLERNYDVILNAAEIRGLTFSKLRALSDKASGADTAGEEASVEENHIQDRSQVRFQGEKVMPTETVTKMTKTKGPGRPPLFFVHAIEGTVSSLEELVGHLEGKEDAYGLQCTAGAPLQSIQSLAKFYTSEIKKIQKKGPYRLIGYSFGSAIAFEIAVQLEKIGEKSSLFCIDGSPGYMLSQTGAYKQKKKDAGDADALVYFAALFRNINPVEFYQELKALPDLRSRAKLCAERVAESTSYNVEELTLAAESFYKKLYIADTYKTAETFNGRVFLVKASENYTSAEADYGLSQICTNTIKIETVPGDHRQILTGQSAVQVSEFINTF